MTYPAATANLVVLWGRWWDHLTKAGVDATITATPLLATGQAGSGSPNLVSLVDQAEIKTAAWSTKPLPGSGLWALPLLPTNDAQFGAFGGYRIQAGSEPPFIVEILENTPTMVMSADMIAALNAARTQSNAAPIGISVNDVAQAVWVRQAAVLQQPAVAPPTGVLTSDQTVNLVAGVRQLPLGGTPGQVPTPKAGGGYEWTTPAAASSGLDAEGVRDTVGEALAAGAGARVLVDDPGDKIVVSAVGDLPEATQNARTSAIATVTDLLDKTSTYRGIVTQPLPEALPGRTAAFRQETVGLTLTPATPASGTPDVFVLADGSTATSLSPALAGELVTLRCTHAGRWRSTNILKPQSALDARNDARYGGPVVLTAVGDGTTDDTASINAQLAAAPAGSLVRGVPGRNYLITAPLVTRAGGRQTLDLTGCMITLKAGSNCNMLQNAAVGSTRRVLDAATTSGSATITSATAAFTSADVGKRVRIENAASGGVHDTAVATVTDTTTAVLAVAPSASVTGEYMAIGDRDSDIVVIGGYWDRQNNNSVPSNTYNAHSVRFRHVDRLTVRGVTHAGTGGKYAINPGDCHGIRCQDITFTASSSDGVHFNGPCSHIVVRDILGGTMGDDLVSLTARDTFAIITDCAGDITDVDIAAVKYRAAQTGGSLLSSVLKMCAGQNTTQSTNYKVARLTARDLTGPSTTQAVVMIGDTYGGVGGNGGRFEDITIDGVRSLGGSGGTKPTVSLHAGTMDRVVLRGIRPHASDWHVIAVDTTVGDLIIGDIQWACTTAFAFLIAVYGSVDRLELDGVQARFGANGQSLVRLANAAAVITRLALDNVTVSSSSGGATISADSASTGSISTAHLANLVTAGIAYPLGEYRGVTALSAVNVHATGVTKWLYARGTASVAVQGAGGFLSDADGYATDAGAAVLLRARNNNVFTGDPDVLTVGEENLARHAATITGLGGVSGRLFLAFWTARKTETITQVRTLQGSQAAATATLCRIGIYSVDANGNLTLVASTANDTTLWGGTFGAVIRSLSAAWAKIAGQRYAIGLLSVASTAPKWVGTNPALGGEAGIAPRLCANVDSQTDLPASIAASSLSNSAGAFPYAVTLP